MSYEAVIGLEAHAQLLTESKIFCGCSAAFGGAPNTHVCPVCLGMPGVLPVLNRRAVEYTVRMGLAVDGTVSHFSRFARKNYFYPDLPKGYQISQYDRAGEPICVRGRVLIETEQGTRPVRLRRIHLEEEAGKSIHDEPGYDPYSSYIDYNRTGVPLMEIVSEPDIRSAQDASAYLTRIRQILQYIGVCDGNMEEGSLRCDANVSIRKTGEPYGELVEIKNMNSMRAMERAIEYEIQRQTAIREQGGNVVRETRLWNDDVRQTFPMRTKEFASDYRYFPDPDLVALEIDADWVERIRAELPELPAERARRFMDQYGLSEANARLLTEIRARADYFETCLSRHDDPRLVCNWMLSELLRVQNERRLDQKTLENRVPAGHLATLLNHIRDARISGKIAKDVLDRMVETGASPDRIIQEQGLNQISDTGKLEETIARIFEENPAEVEGYRGGKTKLLGFFVGQVMKATQGKANPQLVNELLKKRLE
jgi:aspartyl-tRNA(Asn)/glutamyl-tRNA(Gln) amidotransferase subunit B